MDLVVDGLDLAPQACLLDTGASEVRLGAYVAEMAGIELPTIGRDIVIGGLRTTGRPARIRLELRQGAGGHAWSPNVYFCDPWPWSFGLLGLAGLDPFQVVVDTCEEWVELRLAER